VAGQILEDSNEWTYELQLGNRKLLYKQLSPLVTGKVKTELDDYMFFNANINLHEQYISFRKVIEDLLIFEEMGVSKNDTRKKALFAAKNMIDEEKAKMTEIQRVTLFHPEYFHSGASA
jgi:hypothetical protein